MAEIEAKPIVGAPPDAVEEARRDVQAEADYAAGRCVTHDRVKAWLQSWGTKDELPCPEPEGH